MGHYRHFLLFPLQEGDSEYFPEVPILFRSTPSRDVPTVALETIMYAIRLSINDYQDSTRINLFTTP